MRAFNRYSVAIWLLVLVALAGCGTLAAPTDPGGAITIPSPPAIPVAADVLVLYQRSGCFDGVRDELTVYSDGRLELVNRLGVRTKGRASAQALSAVQSQLQAMAGVAVPGAIVPPDACVYTINARLADGTALTATTNDAARQSAPDSPLFATIDALESLRQQIR
jgi:hypothetical protein